ncbi:MAG: LamG domain-containing protein [Candidatus Paceibacterota bacterium]
MNKLTAFTLIELLVVIAIIGILSGLIIVTMSGVTAKANIAKSQVFSNSLKNALMMNLVSEWKFDELSSATEGASIKDFWSGGNNGTLYTNSDGLDKLLGGNNCISGKCISLDGVDDYINCGNQETLKVLSRAYQDSSWSFWFKTTSGGEVIGKYQPFQFLISEGKMSAYIYNGTSHLIGSPWQGGTTVNDGKWHYAVYVVDRDGYFSAYLDSSNEGSPYNISTHAAENWLETTSLYIGVRNPGSNNFNGSIDDIRIYNAIMPTSQIKEQYYAGLNSLYAKGRINNQEYQSGILGIK